MASRAASPRSEMPLPSTSTLPSRREVNLLPAGISVANYPPRFSRGHPERSPSPLSVSAVDVAVPLPAGPSTSAAGPPSDCGAQGGASPKKKPHKPPVAAPEDRAVCAPVRPATQFAKDDSPALRLMKRLQQRMRSSVVIAEQYRAPRYVFTTTKTSVIRTPVFILPQPSLVKEEDGPHGKTVCGFGCQYED